MIIFKAVLGCVCELGNCCSQMHRIMAHKSEGFKCRICAKMYTRLTHLRRHIGATHPGIVVSKTLEDISCHICSRLFTRMEHLKRHLATHDTKPPKIEAEGNGEIGDGETSKESMNEVFLPSELIQVTSAADCKSEDEETNQDDDDDEDEKP